MIDENDEWIDANSILLGIGAITWNVGWQKRFCRILVAPVLCVLDPDSALPSPTSVFATTRHSPPV